MYNATFIYRHTCNPTCILYVKKAYNYVAKGHSLEFLRPYVHRIYPAGNKTLSIVDDIKALIMLKNLSNLSLSTV